MIQCPNFSCQATNAEAHQFCQTCQAPLPRRVLWAVGHRAEDFKPGVIISERYLCKAPKIFLDLKPGLPPGTLADIPFTVLPYLRLFPYRLHLPQIYGWADGTLESGDITRLMFLENAALSTPINQTAPHTLPSLQEIWPSGSPFQQLHWLWQMANLWHPFAAEAVSSTLLIKDWIRVEASLIRFLQLYMPQPNEQERLPGLPQLGKCWQGFLPGTQPAIRPFVEQICQKLMEGYFQDGQALVTALDLGLQAVGRSHTIELGIATQTDKGPSRANNQDACFPSSGSTRHATLSVGSSADSPTSLLVVCDGIGGHQGGEIASASAIEEISQGLQTLAMPTEDEGFNPWVIQNYLNVAITQANDAINKRNDDENRRDRARMGTTVVMGLIHNHECYLANVGDSRVYWITRSGCHQITLDDDVASREARLGYGTYRSVVYHPNSGALVQALGMGASKNLYPSGQRIILDGEGLLLFCSDGLSDQDLIESTWHSTLSPLLETSQQEPPSPELLGRMAQELVDLANTYNGHDNVTIGLFHWQSKQTAPIQLPPLDTLIHDHNRRVEQSLASAHDVEAPEGRNPKNPPTDLTPPTPPPGTTTISLTQPFDPANFDQISEDKQDSDQRTAFPDVAVPGNGVPSPSSLDPSSLDPSPFETDFLGIPSVGTTEQAPRTAPESTPSPSTSVSSISSSSISSSSISPSSISSNNNDIDWISPASSSSRALRSPLLAGITMVAGLLGVLALGGAGIYFGMPEVRDRIKIALGISAPNPNNDPQSPSPSLPPSNDPNALPDETPTVSPSPGLRDMDEALTIGHILNVRTSAPIPRTIDPLDNENQQPLQAENTVLFLFEQPPGRPVLSSPSSASQVPIDIEQTDVKPTGQESEQAGINQPEQEASTSSLITVGIVPWGSILKVTETFTPLPSSSLPVSSGGTPSSARPITPTASETIGNETISNETIGNETIGNETIATENRSDENSELLTESSISTAPNELAQNSTGQTERWVEVQLCFAPSNSEAASETSSTVGAPNHLPLGSIGWISERQLKELSYLDKDQSSFNDYCSSIP